MPNFLDFCGRRGLEEKWFQFIPDALITVFYLVVVVLVRGGIQGVQWRDLVCLWVKWTGSGAPIWMAAFQ